MIAFEKLQDISTNNDAKKVFVVGSKRAFEPIKKHIEALCDDYVLFSDFQSNPTYDDEQQQGRT